ncbi:MAG: hypothetical protein H7Y32_01070, partial [Chloroflexales bacterium]|nr:hypothetical protein [Chloroflexales bacterium]
PRFLPFNPELRIVPPVAEGDDFYKRTYYGSPDDWRMIETDWLRSSAGLALNLAADTNNTSLVLAIELVSSGKVLLFTGDAQVGNWLSWRKLPWPASADSQDPNLTWRDDLLRRTVFYKVGHHGSENATLSVNGLKLMTGDNLVAMIPLNMAMAKNIWDTKDWPHPPLLRELLKYTRGRVIVADPTDTLPTPEQWLEMEKNLRDDEKHDRAKVIEIQKNTFTIKDTHIDYEMSG